jgi:hypothetical protein
MSSPRLSHTATIGLLAGVALVVGTALAFLGSAVLIPQGGVVVILVVAVGLFLAAQLVLFRALGLRSAADDEPTEEDPSEWRPWKG